MIAGAYLYIRNLLARANDPEGQSLAEYAILVMVVAFVVLAAASLLGVSVSKLFQSVVNAF